MKKYNQFPPGFVAQMESMLGDEAEAFFASYGQKPHKGIRVNTLKISVEDFKALSPFDLQPVPWCDTGFYVPEDAPVSKHPYYRAGLYYIQEPSAMITGAVTQAQPGEWVADLCGAPGGKSTQIAGGLRNQGLLLANDISNSRARALLHNLELAGVRNMIVSSEDPKKIASKIKHVFDAIVIDAPCSGEGMFRKDPKAIQAYDDHAAQSCRDIQNTILDAAGDLVAGLGRIVYSTCTYNRLENEDALQAFMERSPHFVQAPITEAAIDTSNGWGRIWPHRLQGEGHFVGSLVSGEDQGRQVQTVKANQPPALFKTFMDDHLIRPLQGHFLQLKDQLYLLPEGAPQMDGLRVLRSGWLLGTLKKNRFEPSQAFSMGLKSEEVNQVLDLNIDQHEVMKYLKGDTLMTAGDKG